MKRFAVLALLIACGGSTGGVAPIVVPPQPPQPPETARAEAKQTRAASETMPRLCNVTLKAGKIRTRESCFLDERISHGPGTLALPCDGADGLAEVSFEEQRFTGHVKDGVLTLDTHAELDWNVDGCHWENDQHIVGALASGKLTWTYSEKPTRGVDCAGTCKGSADINVEQ